MTDATRALIEAAEEAYEALRLSYNVTDYPADGDTTQDHAMKALRAAISSAKAAEEGVETDWRVECERDKLTETFLPDDLEDARLVYLEVVRDYPNAKKISLIRRDTYTTVIEVREKEGL